MVASTRIGPWLEKMDAAVAQPASAWWGGLCCAVRSWLHSFSTPPWYVKVEQSAIPQLRSHASRTKTTRFQNQTTRFPNQSWRASTTTFSRFHNHTLTIPQQKSLHSTTKLPRFHNQNLRIPQPNSHDSTTNISGFHNQNLAILQLTTIDSTRKTAATYFHRRNFLTSYKKLKESSTPAKQ